MRIFKLSTPVLAVLLFAGTIPKSYANDMFSSPSDAGEGVFAEGLMTPPSDANGIFGSLSDAGYGIAAAVPMAPPSEVKGPGGYFGDKPSTGDEDAGVGKAIGGIWMQNDEGSFYLISTLRQYWDDGLSTDQFNRDCADIDGYKWRYVDAKVDTVGCWKRTMLSPKAPFDYSSPKPLVK